MVRFAQYRDLQRITFTVNVLEDEDEDEDNEIVFKKSKPCFPPSGKIKVRMKEFPVFKANPISRDGHGNH